jgi:SSS family solute:Na+ symporter
VTNAVQVAMLVLGGLVILFVALERISEGSGAAGGLAHGFSLLVARVPDHFHMILSPGNPYYKYVPGLAVLAGGMWIINLSYWGFNQSIIERALTAGSVREAQAGVLFAAILKLLVPVLVVLPGIAAVVLVPELARPDAAYATLMTLLPAGLLGLVFIALVAAIVGSMRSTLSSIATVFAADVFGVLHPKASARQIVIVERAAAIAALVLAMSVAMPILGNFDQAFQYIQEYNGYFTPGIVVVFLLGMFWPRATEAGALIAAIASPLLSLGLAVCFPGLPFMDRIGWVFAMSMVLAIGVSLALRPVSRAAEPLNIDFSTSVSFNVIALAIVAVLVALYVTWW